jgi:fumarylacetoacetase
VLAGIEAAISGRATLNMATPFDPGNWRSWVESANDAATVAPLQCLPYCSFSAPGRGEDKPRLGVGIGSFILDLKRTCDAELLSALDAATQAACSVPQLNALMQCGPAAWSGLRRVLMNLLKEDDSARYRGAIEPLLVPKAAARFFKPVAVPNYTDFYASIHHAANVGRLFRPEQPLLPNYKWVPIGYHGRASSLVVSGTDILRPGGQRLATGGGAPVFGPTLQLDYELEVAAYIGTGNALGLPIAIERAEEHIFGLTLLNDWSARDIQAWEYQPLGPFLGKSFATSVSPWVVPMAALEPYRLPLQARAESDPAPLSYLAGSKAASGFEMRLEALLSTARMRADSFAPMRLSESNLCDLYWSFAQLVAHHTSNGCNLETGDLLASGTVSGPDAGSQGCLLEMTQRGASPVVLPHGERRTFLEDGDEVILRGVCERDGLPRMEIGECRGKILPARELI